MTERTCSTRRFYKAAPADLYIIIGGWCDIRLPAQYRPVDTLNRRERPDEQSCDLWQGRNP